MIKVIISNDLVLLSKVIDKLSLQQVVVSAMSSPKYDSKLSGKGKTSPEPLICCPGQLILSECRDQDPLSRT